MNIETFFKQQAFLYFLIILPKLTQKYKRKANYIYLFRTKQWTFNYHFPPFSPYIPKPSWQFSRLFFFLMISRISSLRIPKNLMIRKTNLFFTACWVLPTNPLATLDQLHWYPMLSWIKCRSSSSVQSHLYCKIQWLNEKIEH